LRNKSRKAVLALSPPRRKITSAASSSKTTTVSHPGAIDENFMISTNSLNFTTPTVPLAWNYKYSGMWHGKRKVASDWIVSSSLAKISEP
jgi:hypothetical protein